MPSLTSALSALFLLCLCVCPIFHFSSAKEFGGSNTGAALPAKQPCPLAMPTLVVVLGLAWALPGALLGTWLLRLGNISA